jgi:hypothetical protein
MGDYLKEVLASGRKLLTDTKSPKIQVENPQKKPGKVPNPAAGSGPLEKDPHKVFVKRAIQEKMKKHEVVSEVQKFCDDADSRL